MDPSKHQDRNRRIRSSYDTLSAEYASRIYGELSNKPFDRQWLDGFSERVKGHAPVCDLGCGPAHIGRYLQDRGVHALGLDLSFGNLRQASRLNPDLLVLQGDMLALPFANGSLGGVAAFYSIIHLRRDQLPAALLEMRRVLHPGGALTLAFHLGQVDLHENELWGHAVDLDVTLFTLEEVVEELKRADLTVERSVERDPYAPQVEYQGRRGYVVAARSQV